MYRKLLLSKRSQRKLSLYRQLLSLEPGTYSFSLLSQHFSLSYSRIASLIKELSTHLVKIKSGQTAFLSADQKVMLTNTLPSEEILSTYLIQQDIPYLFLLETIENNCQTMDDFAYYNHLSPSTIRRKLLPLKKFFSEYHVTVKFSSLELLGSERMIRALLTVLLWFSSKGQKLPIDHYDVHQVNRKMKSCLLLPPKNDHLTKGKLFRKLDADVTYHRIANQHYVEKIPESEKLISDRLILAENSWGSYIEAPSEHHQAETSYMAARLFYGPVFYYSHDPALLVVQETLSNSSPVINTFLLKLKQFISQDILKTGDAYVHEPYQHSLLLGNFLTVLYNYMIFKSKIPFSFLLNEDAAKNDNLIFHTLVDRCKLFMETAGSDFLEEWLEECIDDICLTLAAMLFPDYLLSTECLHLNIAVVLEDQYIYIQRIKQYLTSLPYVNYLEYRTDSGDQYDAVISSNHNFSKEHSELPVLFFQPSLNISDYFKLGKKLEDIYLKKATLSS